MMEFRHGPLHLNSVASIRIMGLSRVNSGQDHELVIPRMSFLAPKIHIDDTEKDTKYDLLELRHPPKSTLPPIGDIELVLKLGDVLSTSPRNTVYEVNVVFCHGDVHIDIPPLVLKIASEKRGRHLAEEGGMYNHLESLQGIVTPRCYGYFQTLINHTEMTILPWDIGCAYPRDEDKFDIFQMPNAHACLAALLLERVGKPVTGIQSDRVRRELEGMAKELADLGVKYNDWRAENVLMAPHRASPIRPDRMYRLRLIDFEDAEWTNNTVHTIMRESEGKVEEVVRDIGYILDTTHTEQLHL